MSDNDIEKTHYTIGEVAKMLKVTPALIRFWEKEFDSLQPAKTSKGTRKFSQKDIQQLRLIHHLVKEKGFTLQGANEQLKHDPQAEANAQMLDSLKRVRGFLAEIKKQLDSR
jgi:DNA-binding transcriptional MerR regulator